jgi:hypothetical protein
MPTSDFKTGKGIVIAELVGLGEQLRRINEARDFYTDSGVRAAYDAGARAIAAAARSEAPVNRYPVKSPGLLRKSIVGKAFAMPTWRRWGPGGFAQVTLRRGARNRAPHANIIVPGRKALVAKPGKRLRFNTGGLIVNDRIVDGQRFAPRVAAVPPNDFWRRGMQKSARRAEQRVIVSLERAWNKRVKG